MDTKHAFRPSTHPELWGQHPSPAADCRDETPEYRRRNRPLSLAVVSVTAVVFALIFAVSAVAGWLWPL